MTLRDFGPEITQVSESMTAHIRAQHSVLQEKMKGLAEAQIAVMESRTDEELAAVLDRASEDLEQYSQELRENFLEFEEEIFQIEEGILDRFAEDGWSERAEEPEHDEGTTAAEDPSSTQPGHTVPPNVSVFSYSSEIAELQEFISPHQGDLPSLRQCRERLHQAESLQQDLHARWLVESRRANTVEDQTSADALFEETAQLEAIIREIRSLAHFVKKLTKDSRRASPSGTTPPQPRAVEHDSPASQENREPHSPKSGATIPSDSGLKKSAADLPSSAEKTAGPFIMSPDCLEKYEEDYLEYRSLFIHLRRTAQNKKEVRDALRLGKLLQTRRRELEQWRHAGSCPAGPPPMISQVFSATTSDETKIGDRGGQRRAGGQKKTNRERKVSRKMRDILRDLFENPGAPQASSNLGDVNRRVFLTAGRINPRAAGTRRK